MFCDFRLVSFREQRRDPSERERAWVGRPDCISANSAAEDSRSAE
jgi:hypothetical protein